MKGKWLASLVLKLMDGTIAPKEALAFLLWRVSRSPRALRMQGVRFYEIDRTTWGLIAGIILNQEYNPPGFEIGAQDVVVDIGAHKGVFLGYAATRTHGPVIGVEPDPDNFRALGLLVRSNRLDNVKLINAAVAEATGDARLFQGRASSRHTLIGLDVFSGEALSISLPVSTISLDDLCLPHPVIHFLKMDCEGAEHAIVQSAHEDTIRKIDRLVMEVHDLAIPGGSEALLRKIALHFNRIDFKRTSPHMSVLYARRG